MDTETGAHNRRHAASDEETTNNVLYATNVLSIQELINKSKDLLTKMYGRKEVVDFIVPYISWFYLQLSTLHENQKTEYRYTGKLPFKHMLLSHTYRDNAHTRAHWVAGLKKYWQYHEYCLFRFIADAL